MTDSSKQTSWLYTETQRFTQWWIWTAIVAGTAAFIYALFRIGFFSSDANDPGMHLMPMIALVALMLAIALLASMRLDVKINESAVYYKFFPLHRDFKFYEWSQIEHAFIRKYKPILEYGGWGIRPGIFGSGWAYNVAGNMGLQIELKTGKKLLLGTQRPDDLERVLNILRGRNIIATKS